MCLVAVWSILAGAKLIAILTNFPSKYSAGTDAAFLICISPYCFTLEVSGLFDSGRTQP
jgi:hypothetical protein